MTIIASSVAAMQLLHKLKCPHCGAVQERIVTAKELSIQCSNCLRRFSPQKCRVEPRSYKR